MKYFIISLVLIFNVLIFAEELYISDSFDLSVSLNLGTNVIPTYHTGIGPRLEFGYFKHFDEVVMFGFGFGFYFGNWAPFPEIAVYREGESTIEYTTLLFPVFAHLKINIPVDFFLTPTISTGGGLNVLVYREKISGKDDLWQPAIGPSCFVAGGIVLPLGRRTDFYSDLGWQFSFAYRPYLQNYKGYQLYNEYNLCQLFLKVGVRFLFFKTRLQD